MSDIDAMPPMPTDHSVVRQLAQLDRTESALVLASGMAAVACTMVSLLRPGDHLLASRWLRPETRRFFEHELPALGVSVSFVDPTETRGWRRSLTRTTRLMYLESPADPTTTAATEGGGFTPPVAFNAACTFSATARPNCGSSSSWMRRTRSCKSGSYRNSAQRLSAAIFSRDKSVKPQIV